MGLPECKECPEFQSTRPSRGATRNTSRKKTVSIISIHAPLAGRDHIGRVGKNVKVEFQSTRPSRGATAGTYFKNRSYYISIHAPLAGRDKPK